MNRTTLTKLFCSILCLFALSACADKYFEDPTLELYTRSFINTFGLISPEQDWNMAQTAKVTVNLGSQTPELVKVYTKTDGRYFLAARLHHVTGRVEVPMQVPKGTTDVKVLVGSSAYFGHIGETIDCGDVVLSRDIAASTTTAGDWKVSVSYATTGNLYDQTVSELQESTIQGVHQIIKYGYSNPSSKTYYDYGSMGYNTLPSPLYQNDALELNDGVQSRYQYFNSQQILPIVMNGDGTEDVSYYSLNSLEPKTFKNRGILPENGTKNQYKDKEQDTKFTQYGIDANAVVKIGSTGKLTIFPYYYNATYIHQFGIYLIDDNGDPIRENPSDPTSAIIKYPVFNDKQSGDIQISTKLVGISKIECPDINIDVGDTINLYDYVKVYKNVNGTDVEITDYPDAYSSKLGFHYFGEENVEHKNKTIWFYHDGNVYGNKAGTCNKFEIAAEGKDTEINITVKGNEVKLSPDFTYTMPNGVTFVKSGNADDPWTDGVTAIMTLQEGAQSIIPLNVSASKGTTPTLKSLEDKIRVDNYDHNIFEITNDANGNFYVEGISSGDAWTHIRMNYDGYESDIPLNIKVTCNGSHRYSDTHSYDTNNASDSPISLTDWQTNYFETSTYTGTEEIETTLWEGSYVASWNPKQDITPNTYNWSNVSAGQKLRVYFTRIAGAEYYNLKLMKDWEGLKGITHPNLKEKGVLALTSDGPLDIDITNDMLNDINGETLSISGFGFKLTKVSLIRTPAPNETYNIWKSTGKASAKAALEAYYAEHNPGEKNCSNTGCNTWTDFSGATPVVTIANDADYDNIRYTVTWQISLTSPAPKRVMTRVFPTTPAPKAKPAKKKASASAKTPSRVKSRDGSGMPTILEYPKTDGWSEVNKVWNRQRPLGDEAASFITDDPILARSRGYTIEITDPNNSNKKYSGKVGFYIDVYDNKNAYDAGGYEAWNISNWTDYNGDDLGDTSQHMGHKWTLYSQSKLNAQKYTYTNSDGQQVTETFDMSYATAFKHPLSPRQFYSFEDWKISHPAKGDVSRDGHEIPSSVTYSGSDYSSDRDFNDLIYVLQLYNDAEVIPEDDLYEKDDVIYTWLWALEDLGSTDDFDFNDIVIKINAVTEVQTPVNAEGIPTGEAPTTYYSVTLTPLAAGGTLPLFIHYTDGTNDYVLSPGTYDLRASGNTPTIRPRPAEEEKAEHEYHKWFGANHYSNEMMNTGKSTTNVTISKNMECELLLDTEFSLMNQTLDYNSDDNKKKYFYVNVRDKRQNPSTAELIDASYTIPRPTVGLATQSFIIYCGQKGTEGYVKNWAWPSERTPIIEAYPEFKTWVSSPSSAKDWYLHPSNYAPGLTHSIKY